VRLRGLAGILEAGVPALGLGAGDFRLCFRSRVGSYARSVEEVRDRRADGPLVPAGPMVPGRGRLHVFLGAAPGAGKTYAMLAEGRRLAESGSDVVIGLAETHGRDDIEAMAVGLERVPLRQVSYRGTVFAELDLGALLARHPRMVLVDELAHACRGAGTPSAGKTWRNSSTRASA